MRISRSIIKKPAVTLAGGIVVLAGLVMLVTPGPGLVAIAAGLAILATEYDWAERLLRRVRQRMKATAARLKRPRKPPQT